MTEEQKTIIIKPEELISKVKELCDSGHRLVQIDAVTQDDGLELNYSFDKDYHFVNFRLEFASKDIELPSISEVYWNAFLYENELNDLYGINITNIAVDYKGNLYKTSVKHPFSIVELGKKKEGNA
ncbi:NADH-quinone oxidoreductase subunit C [Candidatus Auribacterota bacterium]